jgi:hypothetical protein
MVGASPDHDTRGLAPRLHGDGVKTVQGLLLRRPSVVIG